MENNQVSLPGSRPKDPLDAIKVDLVGRVCGTGRSCTEEQYREVLQAQGELSQDVNKYAMGTVVAGGTAAGLAAAALVGPEALAAYKAAQAGYSLTTAALTGAGVSGSAYLGSIAAKSYLDASNIQDFLTSFNQQFSPVGLSAAATVGGCERNVRGFDV